MAFYTRQDLEARPIGEQRTIVERYHRKSASTRHLIFLSHSHKDQRLLLSVADLIGRYSDAIYIDWKDDEMPAVTSPATARRVKAKISSARKFILLATNNALTSKWVPWELGIADQANNMKDVAILPVTEPPYSWTGNEYIGIYRHIEPRDSKDRTIRNEPAVIDPETGDGEWLKDWLTS